MILINIILIGIIITFSLITHLSYIFGKIKNGSLMVIMTFMELNIIVVSMILSFMSSYGIMVILFIVLVRLEVGNLCNILDLLPYEG